MALLTTEFATERALASLREALVTRQSRDIARWAKLAAETVMETARLATVPDEHITRFEAFRSSVASHLDSMPSAIDADDTGYIARRGALVADAVANLAAFLKGSR